MPVVRSRYTIDLSQAPGKRWATMIRAERARAKKLIRNAMEDGENLIGAFLMGAIRRIVPLVYDWAGKEYENAYEDIGVWARDARIDRRDLILANLTYELSPGCTAVAFNLPRGGGVCHCRNMDWPLVGIGPHSVEINYEGAAGPFSTLGWPGYIGALSGIGPKRFSATINQAPKGGIPSLQWPASFALRWNFENSYTYAEAVQDLMDTPLSAPALFMVAGTEPDEATVIEHAGEEARRRKMRNGALAVANHYECTAFRDLNGDDDDEWLPDSRQRLRCALAGAVSAKGNRDVKKLIRTLAEFPALHSITAQQMAFIPKSGRHLFLYHDTDSAVRESQPEDDEEE